MPRTNFEQLRVYQFSEELSDAKWDIVCKWDKFAKRLLVNKLFVLLTQ